MLNEWKINEETCAEVRALVSGVWKYEENDKVLQNNMCYNCDEIKYEYNEVRNSNACESWNELLNNEELKYDKNIKHENIERELNEVKSKKNYEKFTW